MEPLKKKLREMTQDEKREYWNSRYWKERPQRIARWRQKSLEKTREEKDRLKAYQKLWRDRNKEYVAQKRKERYARESEYEKRRRRERYTANRVEILQKLKDKRRQQGCKPYLPRESKTTKQPPPPPSPPRPVPPPPPPPPTTHEYKTSLNELINDLFPELLDVFLAHDEIHHYIHNYVHNYQ